VLPLYTFLACFCLKEGEKERESKNKTDLPSIFFKEENRDRVRINRLTFCVFKEGRRGRERE
jgi:hypothetical protein